MSEPIYDTLDMPHDLFDAASITIGVSPARLAKAEEKHRNALVEIGRLHAQIETERQRAETAERERDTVIAACVASDHSFRNILPFHARLGAASFWFSTHAEAVAAIRKAAGLDAESEASQ